jgi:hypothetical protein
VSEGVTDAAWIIRMSLVSLQKMRSSTPLDDYKPKSGVDEQL